MPAPADPAVAARWERLCALLDDDEHLWPAVRQALLDPAGYLAARAGSPLAPTDPADVDPWVALIDGLDDAGALAYLDPGDQGEELAEALAALPRVVRARLDLGPVTDTDGDVPTAVRAADAVLAPAGLCLVHLHEDDDAHPLVVVRAVDHAEITATAQALGHRTDLD